MHTTPLPGHHFDAARFTVTTHVKGFTALQTADCTHMTLAYVVLPRDTASIILLGSVAASHIVVGCPLSLQPLYSGVPYRFRERNRMIAEILEKHARIPKIHIHAT